MYWAKPILQKSVYGGVECRFHWQLASVVESVPQSPYKLSGFISVHCLFLFYISAFTYIYIYYVWPPLLNTHPHTQRDPRTHAHVRTLPYIYIYNVPAWYPIVWCNTISIKFYIYCCYFYCFCFTRIVCLMAECLETDRQFHVWDKVPAASFVWNIHIDTYSRILAGKHTHIHKCHKEKNRARI